jgi:hypothetical protein
MSMITQVNSGKSIHIFMARPPWKSVGTDMIKFFVREVVYGGDVDGTGPERWAGAVVAEFDTHEEAEAWAYDHYAECVIIEE